ncbi:MAG: acyltransferase [Bacteroidales bacterium]|nr:acyltransferase [Bacteroidales bacterium]
MSSIDDIFKIKNERQFIKLAIETFRFQAYNNKVYNRYLELNKININRINNLQDIPFMPVELFKTHKLITGNNPPQITFSSSGTTGTYKSKHYIVDIEIYKKACIKSFNFFYKDFRSFCFLALLPSYLEREGSSLIYMIKYFIDNSKFKHGGFYLNNHKDLHSKLMELIAKNIPIILFGVSYALLDFSEQYSLPPSNIMIMETGGMKGRRDEITREELHNKLMKSFNVSAIHSEYGMTELLSQAYSQGEGRFYAPQWMKILIRDKYDPRSYLKTGKTGGINIIDLANVNSISFIETQDIGKINADGSFEVLGRLDNSEIRGCNLLMI